MSNDVTDVSVKVFVCTFDKKVVIQNDMFVPIQVGKAATGIDLGYLSDDTGDNISAKNKYYSEQTGVYWVWKNMQDNHPDYVGFCHYRKYPYMNRGIHSMEFNCTADFFNQTAGINEDVIKQCVADGRIICINAFSHMNRSIRDFYTEVHIREDFDILSETLYEMFPDYNEVFDRITNMVPSVFFPYNIYIMKWDLFCRYCEFIFPLFEEMEKKINKEIHTGYQSRVFGYLAERLLTVFLVINYDINKIVEFPCAIIDEYAEPDYSTLDKK